MAQKINRNGTIKYVCENCNGIMFKVFKDTNDLVSPEDLQVYIKYLDISMDKSPRYTCQFCGTAHKGYYKGNSLVLDFRPLII